MERRYVTVDVFTDRMFGGNPLAVVLDCAGLSTAQMQALAREFNYSETSFVLPPASPAHHARVRIFTPVQELPFAGHPNVGTAYVLAQERRDGSCPERFLFEEPAGLVPVRLLRDGGQVVGAELTAPAPLSRGARHDAGAVAAILSLHPGDILTTRHEPEIVSVGLPFLAVELATRTALRRAAADAAAMASLLPGSGISGLYAYTRAVEAGDGPTQIQARMFAPGDGIAEDPATGSATAAVGALQAALLEQPDAELRLQVGQGVDMGRPSLLSVVAVKAAGQVRETRVGGRCVPVMEGRFRLPGAGSDGKRVAGEREPAPPVAARRIAARREFGA